jgi:hypothetical protein
MALFSGLTIRFLSTNRACPRSQPPPDEPYGVHSPETCGNDDCASAISSIDDAVLSLIKTGVEVHVFCARFARACQGSAAPHTDAQGRRVCRPAPIYPTAIP